MKFSLNPGSRRRHPAGADGASPSPAGFGTAGSGRPARHGVALIVTLIMLGVITFLAVAFLFIARREKASVTVALDQTDSRFMLDSGLARAQAELIATMLRIGSVQASELLISTNFETPGGIVPGMASPTNLSYYDTMGNLITGPANFLNVVSNLLIDPRPPVFVPNPRVPTQALDFRYYIDLNRNRTNEPVNLFASIFGDPHWVGVLEDQSTNHARNNRFIGRWTFMVLPTSKSLDLNFVHNFARGEYYNAFNRTNMPFDGFLRNHGYANWEFNLAGFLADLNTNGWFYTNYVTNTLTLPAVPSGSALFGDAFSNAHEIVRFRYASDLLRLPSFNAAHPVDISNTINHRIAITNEGIDTYADGPRVGGSGFAYDLTNTAPPPPPNDDTSLPWPGGRNPNAIFSFEELVNTGVSNRYPGFFAVLRNLMDTNLPSVNPPYDRTTLYRMLAQMGTDSSVPVDTRVLRTNAFTNAPFIPGAVRVAIPNHNFRVNDRVRVLNATNFGYTFHVVHITNNFIEYEPGYVPFLAPGTGHYKVRKNNRIHLNYNNYNYEETSFVPWTAYGFFTAVGDQLLREYRNNVTGTNLSITNIPVFPTNHYDGRVHQILQLALNIWDASRPTADGTILTNAGPGLPTVFRPLFAGGPTPTNAYIYDFIEETNAFAFLTNTVYRDLNDPNTIPTLNTNVLPFGFPLVIGARKGYPNFNEFQLVTGVEVARKLELRKNVWDGPVVETNQMYLMRVSSRIGVEAWNSYTNNGPTNFFPRDLLIGTFDHLLMHLTNGAGVTLWPAPPAAVPFSTNLGGTFSNISAAFSPWIGPTPRSRTLTSTFRIPIDTNFVFLGGTNALTNLLGASTNVLVTNSAFVYVNSPPVAPYSNWYFRPVLPPGLETYELGQGFYVPDWHLAVTNRLRYFLIDSNYNRIVDFVNLTNIQLVNISSNLVGNTGIIGTNTNALLTVYWNTNRVGGTNIANPTIGIVEQIRVSSNGNWPSASGNTNHSPAVQSANFRRFLSTNGLTNITTYQTPFTPTRRFFVETSLQVNDPLVHYTLDDLVNAEFTNLLYNVTDTTEPQSNLGQINRRYTPWGGPRPPGDFIDPNTFSDPRYYDPGFRDPLVRWSDEWDFPTNAFGGLGWIGRVHRGTPWQSIYWKARMADVGEWYRHSGHRVTHPTNDWRLADLFTIAVDDNAQRGLFNPNQTNIAAWSALLSAVTVPADPAPLNINSGPRPQFTNQFIAAGSSWIYDIRQGAENVRTNRVIPVFPNLRTFLAVPEFSVGANTNAPFLNLAGVPPDLVAYNDADYERLPQQLLSMMHVDPTPRFTAYVWGQSLKPADQSVYTGVGAGFGIVTNYQITGETAAKVVFRVETRYDDLAPNSNAFHTVIEKFQLLPNP